MLIRSARFLVGTLAIGCAGCVDSSERDSSQTVADFASAGEEEAPLDSGVFPSEDADVAEAPITKTDAGTPSKEDAEAQPSPVIEEATYRASCEETCVAQSKCVGLSGVQCADACTAQAAALSTHACLAEAVDELHCLGTLTCDELWAYGTNGRRDHPTCGAQAAAYFAACTVGSGEPPTACQTMCARIAGCSALEEAIPACEETCVLRATGAQWNVGTECTEAFLAVARCVAEASCAEVTELQILGTIPPSCMRLEAARDAACN